MSSTRTLAERLAALPLHVQRRIEDSLLGPGSGPAIDAVRSARLQSLVEAAECELAADHGTAPDIRGNRGPTMAQDARGRVGGHQGYPPAASVAQGATAAATAAVQAAVLAERERLLREGARPEAKHASHLPADFDEALRAAVDHARLARDAGADDAKVKTLLGTYTRMLWRRESVRSEFGSIAELDALADFTLNGGARPRRKRSP